jgi:hypothetical protein
VSEDTCGWYEDIKVVFDNHPYAYLWVERLVEQGTDEDTLARELRRYYDDCIDFILRETPTNAVGHALISQICLNIPLAVFRRIARDYLTSS